MLFRVTNGMYNILYVEADDFGRAVEMAVAHEISRTRPSPEDVAESGELWTEDDEAALLADCQAIAVKEVADEVIR